MAGFTGKNDLLKSILHKRAKASVMLILSGVEIPTLLVSLLEKKQRKKRKRKRKKGNKVMYI